MALGKPRERCQAVGQPAEFNVGTLRHPQGRVVLIELELALPLTVASISALTLAAQQSAVWLRSRPTLEVRIDFQGHHFRLTALCEISGCWGPCRRALLKL